MKRVLGTVACALALVVAAASPAGAAFPWKAGDPQDYTTYKLPPGADQTPSDLAGKLDWMYAATANPNAPHLNNDKRELNGIRGAHLADRADVDQGWRTTTGRPDVTIAVLDSGIKWDSGDMRDIRNKTRLSKGELPRPQHDRAGAIEPGADCAAYGDGWDANDDGVFNILDYACDSRVRADTPLGVNPGVFEPQDVLIAFSDGTDADGNGYVDDIVGWDFLDDDNDPYDDVQYGHGTGEAKDSAGEADNGGDLGTCPNCMEIHLRVGTSFIADVNRFAMAVLYATDNDVLVVQEALGTLNKSRVGADAVKYAYDHGTVVIASAADEAAQHHNWPSSYPYSIVVNSVTHFDDVDASGAVPSYLMFNGCTNFSSRITLAIPSVSCSSDATGRGSGMAALVYSAALNAIEKGVFEPHPTCRRVGGEPCPISANEVRQVMASGLLGDVQVSDDVNFAQDPVTGTSTELSCRPVPLPGCTDPFLSAPGAALPRVSAGRSYPARAGHDQFYGYGRVNMNRTLDAVAAGELPPEVEVTSPDWYAMVDPGKPDFEVTGEVFARGGSYTCQVLVAPGSYPSDATDFTPVPSACDSGPRTEPLSGRLALVSVEDLKALFGAETQAYGFTGRESGAGEQVHSGRPNTEPYGFVVKVVATAGDLTGQDRRNAFLHRDADLLPGFPLQLPGDGEASPTLADLDGDNENELVIANSDGLVYAFERDGSQLDGFPVHTDPLPLRGPATGSVARAYGAVLATPAVGDLDRDGSPEIVVADLESKVYVISAEGRVVRRWRTRIEYSGKPLEPFVNVRRGKLQRVQHGFLGSPVLADMDEDPELEVVAAAMDRHVYVWNRDGSDVAGWPQVVVDPAKVASIDPVTHMVTFKEDAAADFQQGAIIATPAVGNLDDDPEPEIVVGTNESYREPINAGGLDQAAYSALGQALEVGNGRLFALEHDGRIKEGWPFKVGILQAEVLPLVGEGITGSPVIGEVACNGPDAAPRIGTIPAAGVPYLVDADGQSCYGRVNGMDNALPTYGGAAADQPFLAAFGHPAFAKLGGLDVFLAPAAGLQRALDVVLPEYQGGHDYLVAWNTALGKVQPGWPAEVNDLQFLTGPSVADVDGLPGDEVVNGTASNDLQGFTAAGTDVSAAWPKLTGDWTVANPAIGSFGDGDSQVVVALTRSGRVLAYETGAPACSSASWPRFHHDNANSGDARRDAVAPGALAGLTLDGKTLRFTAPGDDLLCGTAARYEVVSANGGRPDGSSFADGSGVPGAPAPAAAGTAQQIDVSAVSARWVAVRAVDEQGNVGPAAVVELDRPGRPKPAPEHEAEPGGGLNTLGSPGAQPATTPPPAAIESQPGAVESITLARPAETKPKRPKCSRKAIKRLRGKAKRQRQKACHRPPKKGV